MKDRMLGIIGRPIGRPLRYAGLVLVALALSVVDVRAAEPVTWSWTVRCINADYVVETGELAYGESVTRSSVDMAALCAGFADTWAPGPISNAGTWVEFGGDAWHVTGWFEWAGWTAEGFDMETPNQFGLYPPVAEGVEAVSWSAVANAPEPTPTPSGDPGPCVTDPPLGMALAAFQVAAASPDPCAPAIVAELSDEDRDLMRLNIYALVTVGGLLIFGVTVTAIATVIGSK